MGKSHNYTNQKFGQLTIINRAPPIFQWKKRYTAWSCLCDCGTQLVVITRDLTSKNITCCPKCEPPYYGVAVKPNQIFTYLTTISYYQGIWKCQCKCGTIVEVDTRRLMSGNTTSCGCRKIEATKENIKKAIAKRTIYSYAQSSARHVYLDYLNRHLKNHPYETFLEFAEFTYLTSQTCFYCGRPPHRTYNLYTTKSYATQTMKDTGNFTYNGLDRLYDTSYRLDNVVTCCLTCNKYKINLSIPKFLNKTKNLIIQPFTPLQALITLLVPVSLKSSIKKVYRKYNDGNLTLKQFYTLSQLPCFYCTSPPSNAINWAHSDKKSSAAAKTTPSFIYSGLDRVDSTQSHNLNNVVPCCKYCNFGKSNLSITQFQSWIAAITSHQQYLQTNQALQLYY